MRRTGLIVIGVICALPSVAVADEEPRFRLELGSAAEVSVGGELEVLPSTRAGAGVRLSEHWELAASLRHAFYFEDLDAYKEPVGYDDLGLGVRLWLPLSGASVYVEPGFRVAQFSEGTGGGHQTDYKNTFGLALESGVDVPVGERFSLGGGLGLSYVLGTEDFDIALVSGEVHAAVRF